MTRERWKVVEVEGFTDAGDKGRVRCFHVTRAGVQGYQRPVGVWHSAHHQTGPTRCCDCSTMSVAMSASCEHVAAVKRWLARATITPPAGVAGTS